MNKIKNLTIVCGIILMLLIPNITKAQSGFSSNRYYQQRYKVEITRNDFRSYVEYDAYGRAHQYEIWKKAHWHTYQGTQTYYQWSYYNGRYQWRSYRSFGNYWYFRWHTYKRYYYMNYNRKIYTN